MSPEILGLVGLACLFGLICIGFPISFTLIFLSLVIGYIGIGKVVFYLMTLQFYSVMTDTVLSAVPFFLFMGYILESSGLMDRLFKAFQFMLARLDGSLYIAVTSTATIFAAATGIVGSSITLLGVMAAPTMRESKDNVRLSAGCISAGGTLGILIPPSIMLVVMGPVVGVPVTDLFAAAILPGILLASIYIIYTLVRC
jgi:TRAP-type mannitol/chloroaromatic compound transport system permease large subunit